MCHNPAYLKLIKLHSKELIKCKFSADEILELLAGAKLDPYHLLQDIIDREKLVLQCPNAYAFFPHDARPVAPLLNQVSLGPGL